MKETILVTAIGSFSAVTVMESLKKQGYRVVGCDIYPAEWIANSKLTDVFYQAPYATDRPAYEAFIRTVCRKEAAQFVMPLTDVEIDLFRGWETAEEETGAILCMSDREVLDICRNKKKQEQVLEPLGICKTIPGMLLSELTEIFLQMDGDSRALVNGLDVNGEMWKYPLVIKPVDGRSSQGLRIVHTPKEMEAALEACREHLEQYLVQPKISGSIITVDIVRNMETGSCVCISRKELLRTLNGAGTSVQVFENQYLEQQCQAIAKALNVHGCVNFEFVEEQTPEEKHGVGVWRFLECNPRFSGGLAFSVLAGYDVVKNHLNCFKGMELEPKGEIREQYIARRYEEFVMN